MAEKPELPENESVPPENLPLSPQPVTQADRQDMLRSFVPILVIEIVLSAIMVLVYLCIDKYEPSVLYGALLGTFASITNFVAMVFSLLKAEHAETAAKGQLQAQGKYVLRMVILLVLLVLALKTGYFSPLATVLPLCFMRIAIYLAQLVYKFLTRNTHKEANS